MKSHLVKVEGTGNDFLLGTGTWANRLAHEIDLVTRLCDRRRGIGADGILAVFGSDDGAYRLVHRNADGSPSAFCANGTRCAARAAVELLGSGPRIVIRTGWAEIPAEIGPSQVTLELPPSTDRGELTLALDSRRWTGWLIEVGVPHLVLPIDDLDETRLDRAGMALRWHKDLGADGANIHFIATDTEGDLGIRSFERGVDSEVLCCGSGVVAAGLATLANTGAAAITVIPASGDRLRVEALGAPPAAASRLTGPARLVAEIAPIDLP